MDHQQETRAVSRRTLVAAAVAGAGAIALSPREALAQAGAVAPPSTVTSPPRDFSPRGAPTTYFTDPDVLTVDPSFDGLRQPNAPIQRLWTGALWSEGPAWNAQGHYLVWSDIPNNRQLRWLEDDGRVSVFRMPSNNSNGNTFDYQGRQISCEHLTRRVVRYELDGSATVIADSYNGKRLNSPNDAVPHPDGSIWFTDPPFCTWVMIGYFASIPRELDEAALIDGANYRQVVTRIFIPVALPGIIAAAIFAFTVSWAQFLYPLAFTTSADQLVLPVGIITSLIKGDVFNWGQIMSGALLGAAPPLVIYAFLMDYYIAGLTAGATKG